MKGYIYVVMAIAFSLMLFFSCDTFDIFDEWKGTDDPNAAKVVEDFIEFMEGLYNTYGGVVCEINSELFNEIKNSVESYYYIDNSADDYTEGGRDGVRSSVSLVLCNSISVISQATVVSYGLTLKPEDARWLPEELKDESITAVATVTVRHGDGVENTRYVVKVGDKWYIRAVYVEDRYQIRYYPETEEIFF